MKSVRRALLHASQHLLPVTRFLICWGLVYAAVLAPLVAWAQQQLVAQSGRWAVSNEDIAVFLLSPAGLVFLAVAGILNLAFLYAQQAGLFVIASASPRDANEGLWKLFAENFMRIPKLVNLAALQLVAFAALLVPFAVLVGVIAWSFLGGHDINFYLAAKPPAWVWCVRLTVVALGGYVVLAAGLFLRWLMAIPYLIRSDAGPLRCLRLSWEITRGRLRFVAGPFVVWWIGWLAVTFVAGAVYIFVARHGVGWGVSHVWALGFLLVGLQGVALLGGLVGASLGGVVQQFLVADLYDHLHPQEVVASPVPAQPPGLPGRFFLVAFVVALGVSAANLWWQGQKTRDDAFVEITAHRGSSRLAPENSLSAIRQAIEDGAEFAEIDVQSTRDGEVVMLHDADLMRMARDPRKVESLTLPELKQIDIGSGFSAKFQDERPATLREVIAVARGRIKLNIELKYNRPDPELVERVLAILRDEKFLSECVVTSLDAESLMAFKRAAPEVPAGLIVTAALGDFTRLPVSFLSLNAAQADPATIDAAQRQGKAVHVWTINERNDALRVMAFGVDNIITDEPAKLVKLRDVVRKFNAAELQALAWSARFLL